MPDTTSPRSAPPAASHALLRALENPSRWNKAEAMRDVGLRHYSRTGDDRIAWRAHDMFLASWDHCHNCDTNLGHRIVIHTNHKFCTLGCLESYYD